MPSMNEDDIYRTSSQYRLWSFSPAALAAARQTTVDAAAKNIKRVKGPDTDPLTVDEELLLVRRNCQRALDLIDFVGGMPSSVKISAVQFLKRFYITASCMDYPPAKMVASAVFLGAKANGTFLDLASFAANSGKKEQEIIAPEFKLAQGNRFSFEIRTPMRALEGAFMLLLEIGAGQAPVDNAKELKAEMLRIHGDDWEKAVGHSIQRTRDALKEAVLLSDAYFLYTPPQIWLGTMMTVDEPLARLYLRCALGDLPEDQRNEVVAVIADCARTIAAEAENGQIDNDEANRVLAKLKGCTNPETSDLIELNAAQKRDPDPNSAQGHASKKLKTENGQIEDPFGPPLAKTEPAVKAEPE